MHVITPQEVMGGGHCVICTTGINRHSQTMTLDTLYDFDLPGDPLDGRKYVCQGCVNDMVRACGLLEATEVKTLKEQLESFRLAYQDLLDSFRGLTAELGDKFNFLPVVPNLDFTNPNSTKLASEAVENVKPKRGRPAKEPF